MFLPWNLAIKTATDGRASRILREAGRREGEGLLPQDELRGV